jgi:hypothetical protein
MGPGGHAEMIVHRLLDAFFRTLDTVDAVRDRVDRALGREPRPDPWAVEWPPPGEAFDPAKEGPNADAPGAEPKEPTEAQIEEAARRTGDAPVAKKADRADEAAADKADKPAKAKPAAKKSAKKKPGRKKKASSKRKGSVDRSGKDLVSERADTITAYVQDKGRAIIGEDKDLAGKKVLARVVWALGEAHAAGVELGLTTNDVSALLSKAADIEVFATNIGRACRDHKTLIAESEPDGRSKRYVLTDDGKQAAADLL